ncbi:hypothetical protein [Desulfosarcina cetonica]|nr:hypothetical protein [Desulfosarcina cetonica]
MNLHIAYWHWLVFGMILIMTEIFIPSFTIFGSAWVPLWCPA